MNVNDLPTVEAILNGVALVQMVLAWIVVRAGQKERHKQLMLGALLSSALFLACYLVYHTFGTSKEYVGAVGWFYYPMLISHIVLAALIPVLVGRVVFLAWKQQWAKHRSLARKVLPIWIYVSFTGILVYLMVHA